MSCLASRRPDAARLRLRHCSSALRRPEAECHLQPHEPDAAPRASCRVSVKPRTSGCATTHPPCVPDAPNAAPRANAAKPAAPCRQGRAGRRHAPPPKLLQRLRPRPTRRLAPDVLCRPCRAVPPPLRAHTRTRCTAPTPPCPLHVRLWVAAAAIGCDTRESLVPPNDKFG